MGREVTAIHVGRKTIHTSLDPPEPHYVRAYLFYIVGCTVTSTCVHVLHIHDVYISILKHVIYR